MASGVKSSQVKNYSPEKHKANRGKKHSYIPLVRYSQNKPQIELDLEKHNEGRRARSNRPRDLDSTACVYVLSLLRRPRS